MATPSQGGAPGMGAPGSSGVNAAAFARSGGFAGNDLVTAVAVAKAESGWKVDAKGGPNNNGSYDWGLFQINDIHKPTQAEKTQGGPNAKRAFAIYKAAGNKFTPWAAYNNGAYKKYIKDAETATGLAMKLGADEIDRMGTGDAWTPADSVANGMDGLSGVFAGFGNKLEMIGGMFAAILIAILFIAAGIVILAKGTAVNAVTKNVRKVVGK